MQVGGRFPVMPRMKIKQRIPLADTDDLEYLLLLASRVQKLLTESKRLREESAAVRRDAQAERQQRGVSDLVPTAPSSRDSA